jgi:hypothetical protein
MDSAGTAAERTLKSAMWLLRKGGDALRELTDASAIQFIPAQVAGLLPCIDDLNGIDLRFVQATLLTSSRLVILENNLIESMAMERYPST